MGPHLHPLSTPHPECPGLPEANIPGKSPEPVRDEGLGTNIPTLSLQQNLGPARPSPRGALLTEAAVRAPLCPHLILLLPSRHFRGSTSKLTYLRGSLGGPSLRHRSSVSQAHAPACTQPRGWNGCRCGIHLLTLQGMRPFNSHAGEGQTLLSAEVKRTRKANGFCQDFHTAYQVLLLLQCFQLPVTHFPHSPRRAEAWGTKFRGPSSSGPTFQASHIIGLENVGRAWFSEQHAS